MTPGRTPGPSTTVVMPRRSLRVLMVTSELDSFARTGGLGDVALGLSRALAARDVDVVIVTPLYGVTKVPPSARRWDDAIGARVGWGPSDVYSFGVVESRLGDNLRVCLLDSGELFYRDGIYGDANGTFGDNELRFAAMSRAALHVAEAVWGPVAEEGGPDVIHAHDWHAALAIIYAKLTMGDAWRAVPSVFTIHNLAFQGVLGFDSLDELGIPREAFHPENLEQQGLVNLMKGAISLSDRVTTVSPTYAREIMTRGSGFGLDGFLRSRAYKVVGIVNGIDPQRFSPEHDWGIPHHFSADHRAGKRACKAALLDELGLGLDALDAPLFASVSRLTWQKGIDLFLSALAPIVDRGARVVLVGSGEPDLEEGLREAEARYPGRVVARIAFDESLARRIYAGSDFFVVPSRYEPCGLTQLYAMRYGAIPIVTDVGGLHDTVTPYDGVRGGGTGFVASAPAVPELVVALEDAINAYWDPVGFGPLVERAMRRDSSWERSAEEYINRVYGPVAPTPGR